MPKANFENFPDGTAVFDVERGQLPGIRPTFWQTDTSVAKNSWGYIQGQDYRTADSLVDDLFAVKILVVKIVSVSGRCA